MTTGNLEETKKQIRVNQTWYNVHCHCDSAKMGLSNGGDLYKKETAKISEESGRKAIIFDLTCDICGSLHWPYDILATDKLYKMKGQYYFFKQKPVTRGIHVGVNPPAGEEEEF